MRTLFLAAVLFAGCGKPIPKDAMDTLADIAEQAQTVQQKQERVYSALCEGDLSEHCKALRVAMDESYSRAVDKLFELYERARQELGAK